MTERTELQPFIGSLVRLAPKPPHDDGNRAALAALRRGLGRAPGSVPAMYRYVLPWVGPETSRRREDAMFVVAALFGLYPHHGQGHRSPLGALRGAVDPRASTDRRVMALLNAGLEEVPTHLRHLLQLLASESWQPSIDYDRLLRDLGQWDAPDRWVQRAWARDWWGRAAEEQQEAASS